MARRSVPGLLAFVALLVAPALAGIDETAPEPPPEALVAAIPFERSDTLDVLIDLAPEGSPPFVMELDTGAGGSVITPGMARALHITVRRQKSSPYRRATRLGRDLQFWVDVRASDTAARAGWDYGLLGADFLREYVVEIDYPGRFVRFYDPKTYGLPEPFEAPDEAVLKASIPGHVYLPLTIGEKKRNVILDTGAQSTVLLTGPDAKRLGVDWSGWLPIDYMTVNGRMPAVYGDVELLHLGPFAFRNTPVVVAPKGMPGQGSFGSVVGSDVLRQFVFRIDYKRRRVWMKRSPERTVTFLGTEYTEAAALGLHLRPIGHGRFGVVSVTPGGRTDTLGIQAGDVVWSPELAEDLSLEGVLERIRRGDPLTTSREIDGVWYDEAVEGAPMAGERVEEEPGAS